VPRHKVTEKILIIEDDESILRGLKLNLEMEGYQIETATNGQDGIEKFEESAPDLIILDIMLPKRNGYEVLEEVRSHDPEVGVLILSAREGHDDKVLGLSLGADDFLSKPFELSELLARIDARLRRKRLLNGQLDSFDFADVHLDGISRRVTKAGEELEMTSREYDLLVYLVRRPDRVVTRAQILNQVWGDEYEGTDRTVDNFIVRLRNKLEDDPSNPAYFQTVRGIGYRFSTS
jgi:DNA-binding response OmpR family regulator